MTLRAPFFVHAFTVLGTAVPGCSHWSEQPIDLLFKSKYHRSTPKSTQNPISALFSGCSVTGEKLFGKNFFPPHYSLALSELLNTVKISYIKYRNSKVEPK